MNNAPVWTVRWRLPYSVAAPSRIPPQSWTAPGVNERNHCFARRLGPGPRYSRDRYKSGNGGRGKLMTSAHCCASLAWKAALRQGQIDSSIQHECKPRRVQRRARVGEFDKPAAPCSVEGFNLLIAIGNGSWRDSCFFVFHDRNFVVDRRVVADHMRRRMGDRNGNRAAQDRRLKCATCATSDASKVLPCLSNLCF